MHPSRVAPELQSLDWQVDGQIQARMVGRGVELAIMAAIWAPVVALAAVDAGEVRVADTGARPVTVRR
jgi:hypothetical protein